MGVLMRSLPCTSSPRSIARKELRMAALGGAAPHWLGPRYGAGGCYEKLDWIDIGFGTRLQ